MFTCANCGKQKPNDDRGSVGLLGNICFLLVAKVPWCPSAVCKDCSRQVRLFGIVGLIIIALIGIVVLAIGYR